MKAGPAIFLDKDGTLVENVPYNVDPLLVSLTPGAVDVVDKLGAAGFRIIVVSNQPGAALGLFPEARLADVERCIQELLSGRLSGFYYCPHRPDSECECRKPAPGLLLRAAREQAVDLAASWMIGDILDDVEAGARAGCRTCLIDNGNETEWRFSAARQPDLMAPDLATAARLILAA